jgi:hypothetical protein
MTSPDPRLTLFIYLIISISKKTLIIIIIIINCCWFANLFLKRLKLNELTYFFFNQTPTIVPSLVWLGLVWFGLVTRCVIILFIL